MTEDISGRAANLAKARAARAANRQKAKDAANVAAVRAEVSGYGVPEAVMATPPRAAQAAPKPPMSTAEASRERARRRSEDVRGNIGDMDQGLDEFFVDPRLVPDGWSYEWKMDTVLGQSNPAYTVQLQRMGWEAVPADRHPEMMPLGSSGGIIERKGMILMERPADLTEEARQIEQRKARNQIQSKQEQLGQAQPGHFERNNKDNPLVKIKKGYEPVQIPS